MAQGVLRAIDSDVKRDCVLGVTRSVRHVLNAE